MSKEITERIKDSVNQWLQQLKEKHPELHLTSQWKTLFPKGYKAGNNQLPVITGSNQGKYLIAEVKFHLPDSLELDPDSIELNLKDEPYSETKSKPKSPIPLDEPLQILNEMIIGINEFLSGFGTSNPSKRPLPVFPFTNASAPKDSSSSRKLIVPNYTENLEELKKEMAKSGHLPEWFTAIASDPVKDELLQKLAEAFAHYRRQIGREVSFKEFFDMYTTHLRENKKLH
ncbi:MAG: hypothetical protein KAJ16_01825, partial [Calditrichia bacterium]|nr:hypothetical protein [Calditrichia bacterium]